MSDFFGEIVEAATDIISGIGDSAEASGIADKAKAQAILINAQIQAKRLEGEQARKDKQLKLMSDVLLLSLGGILLLTTAKFIVLPLVKK